MQYLLVNYDHVTGCHWAMLSSYTTANRLQHRLFFSFKLDLREIEKKTEYPIVINCLNLVSGSS